MKKIAHTWHYIKQNYHITIQIRMFGELLTSLTSSMLAPFLLLYLHTKLEGSVLLPLIIVSLQPLAEIGATIAGGNIADRFGRKPIILGALGMQIVAMVGFMFAESIWLFASLYILNGIGRSFYIPAERAQIADVVPDEKRAEVYGVLNTLGYIGQGLGPVLGMMVFAFEPSYVFGIQACSLLIYSLVFWKKIDETAPGVANEIHENLTKTTVKVDSYLSHEPTDSVFVNLKRWIGNHQFVLLLMLCALPISFFYAQTETVFRLHVQATFADYVSIIAILATVKACLSIGLQIWLIKKTEKLPLQSIMLITCLCFMVTSLLYGYSTLLWPLIAAQLLLTIGESLGLTRLQQYVAQIAPATKRGLYFSIHGTHWDISRSIGPIVGGMIFVQAGGASIFTLTAILLVACYFAYRFVLSRRSY
ncbi:MFS transporter [Paenibacillus sp. N1-5-1-14]|uniref:MDR family MFS transporter n=1 Tax=Paenibacillus radicibacter TaxID=2972488 RepID=UPI002159653D|nr:MFS transporter [Paenibacillus radicibacter]MCR8643966.1 MFS transporter [Paenibacillus radicibacter]